MESNQIAAVALTAIICGTLLIAVLIQAFVASRKKNRLPPAPQIPAMDERLRRIEHAVDAIAIEVERVAEAQRFAAKLLAERKDPGEPLKG